MYQVGLVESDAHIEYFWTALESFSQEELARFIKFACNQERIPQTCLCQEGGPDSAHVPPYPMKIAPPDGTGMSSALVLLLHAICAYIFITLMSCFSFSKAPVLIAASSQPTCPTISDLTISDHFNFSEPIYLIISNPFPFSQPIYLTICNVLSFQ